MQISNRSSAGIVIGVCDECEAGQSRRDVVDVNRDSAFN